MKIVEFYGLPGSGKSTICTEVIKKLQDTGEKVGDIDDYLKTCKDGRWVVKGLFSINGIRFLFAALRTLWNGKVFFSRDVVMRLLRVLSIYAYYDSCVKNQKFTYLVMDQAIIQGYISAFFDLIEMRPEDFKCVGKGIKNYTFISVYMALSPEVASERIDIRSEEDHGRCDKIKDLNARIKILGKQAKNFENGYSFFSKEHSSYKVDGNLGIKEKAEKVLDYVR